MKLNLKALRKDIKITQNDFAKAIGIHRVQLSHIENGRGKLTPAQIKTISEMVDDINMYVIPKENNINFANEHQATIITLKERVKALEELNKLKDELLKAKDVQLSLLNKSETTISLVQNEDKGNYLDWRLINIPNDQYLEIQDGIFDRVILSPKDLMEEWEKVFLPHIVSLDFNKYKVILNRSKKGAHFPLHYHLEKESILCVQGSIFEMTQRKMINQGESIQFEKLQEHEIMTIDESLLILLIERLESS